MDGMAGHGSWLRTKGAGQGDAGGRRRRWSAARKGAIVAESLVAGRRCRRLLHGTVCRHICYPPGVGWRCQRSNDAVCVERLNRPLWRWTLCRSQ